MSDRVIVVGNMLDSKWDSPQPGRVYSSDGISPCLSTMVGGDMQPKIVVYEESESIRDFQDQEQ